VLECHDGVLRERQQRLRASRYLLWRHARKFQSGSSGEEAVPPHVLIAPRGKVQTKTEGGNSASYSIFPALTPVPLEGTRCSRNRQIRQAKTVLAQVRREVEASK
jgi:hypothetical protein